MKENSVKFEIVDENKQGEALTMIPYCKLISTIGDKTVVEDVRFTIVNNLTIVGIKSVDNDKRTISDCYLAVAQSMLEDHIFSTYNVEYEWFTDIATILSFK